MGEWYYIGHYGQLGPLTRDQIEELIHGEVVARDTYVWRAGMTDWIRADMVPDLQSAFQLSHPAAPPPPPLSQSSTNPAPTYAGELSGSASPAPYQAPYHPTFSAIKSDRSRTAAGILQLIIPGVGRMYMGFAAMGVLQLVLTPCMVGWVWSVIDGIVILSGGVKMDGYGRQMSD